MEDPAVMWKFTEFSIKYYTPFLKYACDFVLLFISSGLIKGPRVKEKYSHNQLADGCVQMGVYFLEYVKH